MAPFHQFGNTREDAERSGFFAWFMLDRAPALPPSLDPHLAHYRPNGPAFHELTELVIASNGAEEIQSLGLHLARAFVDHPHNGHFARDIAKSFLRGALGSEAVPDLVAEIESPAPGMTPVITARGAAARPPESATPGYQVFLGRRDRYAAKVGGVGLVLENYLRDGAPWLRMALSLN